MDGHIRFRVDILGTVIFSSLLGCSILLEQNPPADTAKPPSRAQEEVKEKQDRAREIMHVGSLLKALLDGLDEFKDAAFRIRMEANIADVLWDVDKESSRQHFRHSFEEIDVIKEGGAEGIKKADKLRMRRDILQMLARHDSGLCQTLLKTIEKDRGESGPVSTGETSMRFELAYFLAKTDPVPASDILTDSLGPNLDRMVPTVLQAIRESDPALADKLFIVTMAAIQNKGPVNYIDLMRLGSYLITDSQLITTVSQSIPLDSSQAGMVERYLALAFPVIMAQLDTVKPNTGLIYSPVVRGLMPLYERFLPEPAAALRTKANQALPRMLADADPRAAAIQAAADPSDLLKKADAALNQYDKDTLYYRAAMREKDTEKALAIAAKIADEEYQSFAKSLILSGAVRHALEENDPDKAYKYAQSIQDTEFGSDCVESYRLIIDWMLWKKETRRAADLIQEIVAWSSSHGSSARRAEGFLRLAETIAQTDTDQAFRLTPTAVEAMNKADFNAPPEGKVGGRVRALRGPVRPAGLPLMPLFSSLGRADFTFALLMAQSIQNKEASVMAQVGACRGMLSRVKEKS